MTAVPTSIRRSDPLDDPRALRRKSAILLLEERQAARAARMNAFLAKPVDLARMQALLLACRAGP